MVMFVWLTAVMPKDCDGLPFDPYVIVNPVQFKKRLLALMTTHVTVDAMFAVRDVLSLMTAHPLMSAVAEKPSSTMRPVGPDCNSTGALRKTNVISIRKPRIGRTFLNSPLFAMRNILREGYLNMLMLCQRVF